jgi:hypothetical protein
MKMPADMALEKARYTPDIESKAPVIDDNFTNHIGTGPKE